MARALANFRCGKRGCETSRHWLGVAGVRSSWRSDRAFERRRAACWQMFVQGCVPGGRFFDPRLDRHRAGRGWCDGWRHRRPDCARCRQARRWLWESGRLGCRGRRGRERTRGVTHRQGGRLDRAMAARRERGFRRCDPRCGRKGGVPRAGTGRGRQFGKLRCGTQATGPLGAGGGQRLTVENGSFRVGQSHWVDGCNAASADVLLGG